MTSRQPFATGCRTVRRPAPEGTAVTLDADETKRTSVNVADVLSRYQGMARPALRETVRKLHPWPALMAEFTFGWIESDGRSRIAADPGNGGGKGVRAALVLMCARAAGAPAERALPGAVAVELVHAFSLVHDDIMDGDELRRHRPTAWKVYGTGPAVLTGDALLALATATLARSSGSGVKPAMAHLAAALVELVHGQAEDITFEHRPWTGPEAVTVEQYLAMAETKTGALLGSAAAVGTLLGGGSPRMAETMARMGRHAGLAFQMVDDILGVWGDPAVTGKPATGDLRRGKKTLPVLAALRAGGSPARRLADVLTGPLNDEAELHLARRLVEEAGGRAFTEELARAELRRALHALDEAEPPEAAAAELAALCRFLAGRTH